MLECADEAGAIRICGLRLQAYEDQLQPEVSRVNSKISDNHDHYRALHAQLYDRPIPVNDAKMLTHSRSCRILLTLTVLAAIACFVGNGTTFYLLGIGLFLTLVGAIGITGLPLIVGHLAFGGILKLGEARRDMVDKASAKPTVGSSYIDGAPADSVSEPEPQSQKMSESAIHRSIGEAMLLIMIAADLALGFLVGLLVRMHTDEDYTAWTKLKNLNELVLALQQRVAQLIASIEIAKKHCMVGILRAQNARARRRPSYHRALTILLFCLLFATHASWAQNIERYEGILIDTSGSIGKGG